MLAIGLMSGTSMDGIDAALLETDGRGHVAALGHMARPYVPSERRRIAAAMAAAVAAVGPLCDRHARPFPLADAEALVTRAHGEAVRALLRESGADAAGIDIVGFHGQTVLHRPQEHLTIQLGDGPALARGLAMAVVHDFRAADIAGGGEGAPLVPVYHRALALAAGLPLPLAIVNIGGVANVTWIGRQRGIGAGRGENDALLAFDTGPGNALLDDWVLCRTGRPMDEDGRLAGAGRVDEGVLAVLMGAGAPFLDRSPPKSLDRNAFAPAPVEGLGVEDGAATLTAFTAATIARARDHMPEAPHLWIVAGGGARNPTLMAALASRVGGPVRIADAFGWSATFMEAEAFAYLAVRARLGLPITFPGTTGVPHPLCGGILSVPAADSTHG